MKGARVKICGITNLADAQLAVALGADALGFVLAGGPRGLEAQQVAELCAELPPYVTRIGIFVNRELAELKALLQDCHLDRAQLHGDEDPSYVRALAGRAYKAFRVQPGRDPAEQIDPFPPGPVLLDTWHPQLEGGSGLAFDWALAQRVAEGRPLILAGGLRPGNVAQALLQVRPWAVDVSSGVEAEPGHKDPRLMQEFFDAVAG